MFDALQMRAVGLELVERAPRGRAEDEEEAVAVAHPAVAHHLELLLTGGVEDLQQRDLRIHLDLLAVGVLDGRVVVGDEEVLGNRMRRGVRVEPAGGGRSSRSCVATTGGGAAADSWRLARARRAAAEHLDVLDGD